MSGAMEDASLPVPKSPIFPAARRSSSARSRPASVSNAASASCSSSRSMRSVRNALRLRSTDSTALAAPNSSRAGAMVPAGRRSRAFSPGSNFTTGLAMLLSNARELPLGPAGDAELGSHRKPSGVLRDKLSQTAFRLAKTVGRCDIVVAYARVEGSLEHAQGIPPPKRSHDAGAAKAQPTRAAATSAKKQ